MKTIIVSGILSCTLITLFITTRVMGEKPAPPPSLEFRVLAAHEQPASIYGDTALTKPTLQYSREACMDCHDDEVLAFERTTHGKAWQTSLGCEQCHGDLAAHIKSPKTKGNIESMNKKSSLASSQACLSCHEKAGEQGHSGLSEHTRAGVSCVSCHEVHPTAEHKMAMATKGQSAMHKDNQSELCLSCHKSTGAQFAQTTHHRLREGVMECISCHNPHGSNQFRQLRADNITVCVQCHEDKRGPFVFAHGASLSDGCMSCHDSHGSGARNMLKTRDPRTLCISCHSRESAVGVPHGRAGLQDSGDCTRCHSEIHGSNTNPFFTN